MSELYRIVDPGSPHTDDEFLAVVVKVTEPLFTMSDLYPPNHEHGMMPMPPSGLWKIDESKIEGIASGALSMLIKKNVLVLVEVDDE